jgi:serine/threonine protein kinase
VAPEVILEGQVGTAADIWSLAVTVIELLSGEPPYFHLSPMQAIFRMVQDDRPPLPDDVDMSKVFSFSQNTHFL